MPGFINFRRCNISSNHRSLHLQIMISTNPCLAIFMKQSLTMFSKPYPKSWWRQSCRPNDSGIVDFFYIKTGNECCHRFKTFYGCITTSEEWLFFVYNQNSSGTGGVVSFIQVVWAEEWSQRVNQRIWRLRTGESHSHRSGLLALIPGRNTTHSAFVATINFGVI